MKIIGYKVKDIGATVLVNERISVETYNFMDGEFKQYYEPIYQDIQTSDSSVPVAENVEQSITPQPTDDELKKLGKELLKVQTEMYNPFFRVEAVPVSDIIKVFAKFGIDLNEKLPF